MAGLVDGPRARGAFLLRSSMSPPWSVRVQDGAPVAVMAVVRGHAWLVHDDIETERIRLGAGDIAVLRGPTPYLVADEPDRPVQAIILPDQRCVGPEGSSPSSMGDPDIRIWGNSAAGATELVHRNLPGGQ